MANRPTRFAELSPKWQELVRRMQRLNFGTLTNLRVVDGEPELFEDFESVATFRFPGDNSPRSEIAREDFALPAEVIEFIETLQGLYCRRIARVEVRHGLPFKMEVEDPE
ncbi:MAG: hypothetical protein GY838_15785 [bacterium]|nr:hypothetical protein [bacterium]